MSALTLLTVHGICSADARAEETSFEIQAIQETDAVNTADPLDHSRDPSPLPNPLTILAPIRVNEPKKVIGRGLHDPDSDYSLSMACIGERLQPGGMERSCDTLRFLLRIPGGEELLIGPSFFVTLNQAVGPQMSQLFDA